MRASELPRSDGAGGIVAPNHSTPAEYLELHLDWRARTRRKYIALQLGSTRHSAVISSTQVAREHPPTMRNGSCCCTSLRTVRIEANITHMLVRCTMLALFVPTIQEGIQLEGQQASDK
jgi:hypothetical protein